MSPEFLLSYLSHRKDEPRCFSVWHSLLLNIATGDSPNFTAIKSLLNAAQKGTLPKYLEPQHGELDHVVEMMSKRVLSVSMTSDEALLLKQILEFSGWLISSIRSYAILPFLCVRILSVAIWI